MIKMKRGAEKILLSVAEKDPDSAAAYGELVKLYERQRGLYIHPGSYERCK